MKRMLEPLKRALAAIAKHWKALVGSLAAILIVLGLSFIVYELLLLRIPREAIAVGAFLLALLILLLWLFPKWQVRSIANTELKPEERFDRENEARKTLSQILGGLALLIGFYFTWQNLQFTRESQRETERIATEGQITDRFTKAIAQLGDTKLEIRLGGIYALERIAKDSPKDHWPIMEVLTAYVREHAKPKESLPERPRLISQEQLPKLAPDIQAVLTVIGRRTLIYKHGEDQSLDLHKTDLRGADLIRANLDGADLSNTDLSGVLLTKGELRNTNFNAARLIRANLTGAHLHGASLSGADFAGADLTGATGLLPEQLEVAKGNTETKLPTGIPRPKFWQ